MGYRYSGEASAEAAVKLTRKSAALLPFRGVYGLLFLAHQEGRRFAKEYEG